MRQVTTSHPNPTNNTHTDTQTNTHTPHHTTPHHTPDRQNKPLSTLYCSCSGNCSHFLNIFFRTAVATPLSSSRNCLHGAKRQSNFDSLNRPFSQRQERRCHRCTGLSMAGLQVLPWNRQHRGELVSWLVGALSPVNLKDYIRADRREDHSHITSKPNIRYP